MSAASAATRPRTAVAAVISLAVALTLGGCSTPYVEEKPELKVSGAFMPQPVGDMAAGFLTIGNSGTGADKLTSVTSPLSDDVQIHEVKDQKMKRVASFDIPANGELRLERGGNHLMFMDIKQEPKQGDKVAVELHFERSGPITVDLPVEAANHNPAHH
ncbi:MULTISPECIES: copper chaperone PCu(A)C [unclassified Streptomyces]|uniref:copper chaperone PCu(A)C n=1 Tax=unclassified Streptomyces TaxID=2593676 RepID=UPI00339ECB92